MEITVLCVKAHILSDIPLKILANHCITPFIHTANHDRGHFTAGRQRSFKRRLNWIGKQSKVPSP